MTTPHDLDRLQRIRAVTSDYSGYQGLYTALLGVFAILAGLSPLTGAGPLADLLPVGVLLLAALFIAVLILAFTLLPLGPLFPSGTHPVEWEYPVMVPVVGGLVFVVNGLLDHRTLVRTLRPAAESETD